MRWIWTDDLASKSVLENMTRAKEIYGEGQKEKDFFYLFPSQKMTRQNSCTNLGYKNQLSSFYLIYIYILINTKKI